MSRYVLRSKRYTVAYGHDPIPGGGYFFQVYDREKINEIDEGLIINDGYVDGLDWLEMFSRLYNLEKYGVPYPPSFYEHIKKVMENEPF